MKKCVKCNKEMADDSRFCPRCGEDQAAVETTNDGKGESKPWALPEGLSSGDFMEKLHKAALVGIGLTGISVLMPMLRVIGIMEFTIMDYSKFLALVIIALCVYMGHEIMQKNYAVPAVASQGLFAYFLVIYVRYANSMSDMRRGFGSMVRDAVYVEWGTYVFTIGVILTCAASIIAGITSSDKSLCKDTLVSQWKAYTLESVKIHSINIPGYAWIIAVAVILLVITQQANPFRNF